MKQVKLNHKEKDDRLWSSSICYPCLVHLRGASAKQFWDGLERFGEQLEELGIGDEEVDNV